MDYKLLVKIISQTHYNLLKSATKAINQALTIRNWVIGLYIIEFEQQGEDRAAYGLKLLQTLAGSLNHESIGYFGHIDPHSGILTPLKVLSQRTDVD